MSDFTAGFSARHDAAAHALHHAFSLGDIPFSPADLKARAAGIGPVGFSPHARNPKHFAPADPDANPTEGWDPFDPAAPAAEASAFVDPVSAAHATGYAEGQAAARTQSSEEGMRDRELLEALGEALRAGSHCDRDRLAAQLRQTVLHLVTRVVGDVGVSPDLLAARIAVATDLLADSAESALLRVHPDDVPLFDGKLPKSVFAVGDGEIARGSFVLESASTIVEDGPELWLEQLSQAIDRIAVPPVC